MTNFKIWLFNEETINQLLKKSNDSTWQNIQLPNQFQNLNLNNQNTLKKWMYYHNVNNLNGLDVLLDRSSEKEIYEKKLTNINYKLNDLQKDNEIYHKKLQDVKNRQYPKKVDSPYPFQQYRHLNPPIIFQDGFSWVQLTRGQCDVYGQSMGHCGNAMAVPDDRILSLVNTKTDEHFLSFIVNNGILGESKGRNNSKPDRKFHKYIIPLLKSNYIETIRGAGYKPENNFNFHDLSKEQQTDILNIKPVIDDYVNYKVSRKDIDVDKINGKPAYIIEKDRLFISNRLTNEEFLQVATKIFHDWGNFREVVVDLAGNYHLRKLKLPEDLYTNIATDSFKSYFFASYYLAGENVPNDMVNSIAKDNEYSLSYAQEVLRGENVPEIIEQAIVKDMDSSKEYAEFLVENGLNTPKIIVDRINPLGFIKLIMQHKDNLSDGQIQSMLTKVGIPPDYLDIIRSNNFNNILKLFSQNDYESAKDYVENELNAHASIAIDNVDFNTGIIGIQKFGDFYEMIEWLDENTKSQVKNIKNMDDMMYWDFNISLEQSIDDFKYYANKENEALMDKIIDIEVAKEDEDIGDEDIEVDVNYIADNNRNVSWSLQRASEEAYRQGTEANFYKKVIKDFDGKESGEFYLNKSENGTWELLLSLSKLQDEEFLEELNLSSLEFAFDNDRDDYTEFDKITYNEKLKEELMDIIAKAA